MKLERSILLLALVAATANAFQVAGPSANAVTTALRLALDDKGIIKGKVSRPPPPPPPPAAPMKMPADQPDVVKRTVGKPAAEKDVLAAVQEVFQDAPETDFEFDEIVKYNFPQAISNKELSTKVVEVLAAKGFQKSNTLLATSLCADELARRLEDDFVKIYGNNFNLGGLSGFPFAGNTGFGAMSAHIPDDGFCLVIYGPHVGVSRAGAIGKVERRGIKLVDSCCGSAIAASNYLKSITEGGAKISTNIQQFTDFQQGAVQELILPHGSRLAQAENRMLELPYALYDSQEVLIQDIIQTGAGGIKKGLALLGGIQINTGPTTLDYFHPLKFDFINNKGEVVEDMLPLIK